MIIYYFHIIRMSIFPLKNDPPFVIYTYAMKVFKFTFEFLQIIRRRND